MTMMIVLMTPELVKGIRLILRPARMMDTRVTWISTFSPSLSPRVRARVTALRAEMAAALQPLRVIPALQQGVTPCSVMTKVQNPPILTTMRVTPQRPMSRRARSSRLLRISWRGDRPQLQQQQLQRDQTPRHPPCSGQSGLGASREGEEVEAVAEASSTLTRAASGGQQPMAQRQYRLLRPLSQSLWPPHVPASPGPLGL